MGIGDPPCDPPLADGQGAGVITLGRCTFENGNSNDGRSTNGVIIRRMTFCMRSMAFSHSMFLLWMRKTSRATTTEDTF